MAMLIIAGRSLNAARGVEWVAVRRALPGLSPEALADLTGPARCDPRNIMIGLRGPVGFVPSGWLIRMAITDEDYLEVARQPGITMLGQLEDLS